MAVDPTRILEALKDQEGWVDARQLADSLGVTTRTVRNYVRRLNDGRDKPLVESSYHGYRLASWASKPDGEAALPQSSQHPQERRADAILRRLISLNEPISIYDLCDELYVSDSTIEADLRRVRESIRLFDLSLARNRDRIMLDGSEASKRKLIGQLITTESASSFAAFAENGIMLGDYDAVELSHLIRSCLGNQGLQSDDFGINNVAIHLAIMVDRMRHGMQMPEDSSTGRVRDTAAYQAACEICDLVAKDFDLVIPNSEISYLSLVIASNSRSEDYSFASQTNLSSLIDERDIELAQQATTALEHAYYLEPFDSEFVMRVAVHVHSLLQRLEANVGAHNPLLSQIRESYPLVYDMAVFFARAISQAAGVPLSEGEIAFLAFHVGAYLEKNGPGSELVSATFLYVNYHDLYRITLDRIREEFRTSLQILSVEPISNYRAEKVSTDIVFSPVEVPVCGTTQLVVVPPLLKDRDLQDIRRSIEAQAARNRGEQAFSLINRFLTPDLFMHNHTAPDAETLIRELAADSIAKGFANEGFVDEVLAREAMSPTSFGNRLALPHSMNASANRSFLSVVTNDQPMVWGSYEVNLILLMGISPSDRKAFRMLFDSLTEVLSDAGNVMRLSRCTSFGSFAAQLNEMIRR